MKARRDTVPDNSSLHVFFRCNNQQFFLEPECLKQKLLKLMARYKQRYGVKIFDFCIMDNHVHLFVWTPAASNLGRFVQAVLSQEAKAINDHFNRDSQAFRSRYKSPVVASQRYGLCLIKYIYGNRVKVGGLPPDKDPYCSAKWRLERPFQMIENPKDEAEVENNQLAQLIDDYVDEDILRFSKRPDFLRRMIEAAIRDAQAQRDFGLFRCPYTIGTLPMIAARKKEILLLQKSRAPPA